MKKKIRDLSRPTTLGDLDELGSQITTSITKALESYATKEDLKTLATKDDLKALERKVDTLDKKVDTLEKKVDKLDYGVFDIRHRIIDLEIKDPPSRRKFNARTLQSSSPVQR